MKKGFLLFTLFLFSFLGTATWLLQTDRIQKDLVKKVALLVEQSTHCTLFFNNSKGMECSHLLFQGNKSLYLEKISFSIDPFSLLYGKIYVHEIKADGINHAHDLLGSFTFSLPYEFQGSFTYSTNTHIEVEGSLKNGLNATIRLKEDPHGALVSSILPESSYTLYGQARIDSNKEGDLTLFLYDEKTALLHLFSPFTCTQNQWNCSSISGSIFENQFHGFLTADLDHQSLQSAFKIEFLNDLLPRSATFELTGPFEQLHARFDFEELNLYPVQHIGLVVDGTVRPDLMSFNLQLKGELEKHPIYIQGPIIYENNELKIDEFSLNWLDFDGSIKAIFNLSERIFQGNASLFCNHFKEPFQGHLLFNCEVLSSFNASFYPESPLINFSIDSTLTTPIWKWEGLKASLHLDEIDGRYVGAMLLKADKGSFRDKGFEKLSFNWDILEGDLAPFELKGIYKSLQHQDPFLLTGSASLFKDQMRVFFQQFHAVIEGVPLLMEKETLLSFDTQKGLLEGLKLKVGSSSFATSCRWESGLVYLMLDAPFIDLNTFSHLFPGMPLKGQCNGRLNLETDGLTANGTLLGKLVHLEMQGFDESPLFPLQGDFQFRFNEKLAHCIGHFKGPLEEKVEIVGSCPLFSETDPIDFNIDIQGELSPFLKTLMSETTLATGDAECLLNVTGSFQNPVIGGTLGIQNGSYESLVLGCSFQEIDARFKLEQTKLICESIIGRDHLGGTLSGTGTLDFDTNTPFDFILEANNSLILHLDYANAQATGTILFKGTKEAGIFEGDLTLNSLNIRLPDETPTRLNAIEVEYINQPEYEMPPTSFSSGDDPWPIHLDLNLFFPNEAFVTASNFSSEWRGGIELKGTVDDPLLFGDAKILEANFLFNGKHFSSNEGTVHFGGSPGRKTSIYLIAKHDINDLQIDVILKGPLREPEVAFRSNPPKSSREILSWLIFNKGVGEMNTFESAELSRNIIKLSDQISSGPNLLDRFRSSFGIDRIDINSTESDDMSLRVGKYLTNRLFLSVKKSMNDQPNQASIEADLTNNFKAQAEVGDDAEARLMLKWEKDY